MLKSSKNQISIDAGQFSVKSIRGKFRGNAKFTGTVGDYALRLSDAHADQQADNPIHCSLRPIYAKNADIISAVVLSDTILREVKVARDLAENEIESAIEVELSQSLPFSLDEIYFDFQKISGADNNDAEQEPYLAVAVRRDNVDPLVLEIESYDKTSPRISVDVDAFAYGRLISQLYSESLIDDVILLIDVGHEQSRFYFYDANNLIFHRAQQIGGAYATESVAEVYDLSVDEAQALKHSKDHDSEFGDLIVKPFANAFAEQINLAIDFFEASAKSDKDIAKIILTGGGSCLSDLTTGLNSILDHQVEIIDISSLWPDASLENGDWQQFSAYYALALGLLFNGKN